MVESRDAWHISKYQAVQMQVFRHKCIGSSGL